MKRRSKCWTRFPPRTFGREATSAQTAQPLFTACGPMAVRTRRLTLPGRKNAKQGVMQFARVSGLEGDHCCVKAGRRGWKGEPCSALLYGVSKFFQKCCFESELQVCEFVLPASTPLLDPPAKITLARGPDPKTSLNLSWSRRYEGGWGPTQWKVSACPLRSLAGD